MWARTKAFCLHSLTVAWGYCLAIAGAAMQGLDAIADLAGGQDFNDRINSAIGDPKIAGRILLGVSVITILVRLRSLRKAG